MELLKYQSQFWTKNTYFLYSVIKLTLNYRNAEFSPRGVEVYMAIL